MIHKEVCHFRGQFLHVLLNHIERYKTFHTCHIHVLFLNSGAPFDVC